MLFLLSSVSMESFYHRAKRMTWASEQQQLQATLQVLHSLSLKHTHTRRSAGVCVCYAGWSSVEVIRLSVCLQPALSISLSLTQSSTHSRFSTHLLMCFSAWIHSPLQFTFLSPLSKHSSFQAYTHQVSLNEFFIN